MFPFDRPKNYNEMLNKIGMFTFLEAVALIWLVATLVPAIGRALHSVKVPLKVLSIEVPLLVVVCAAGVAVLARIIRLHDKLSDLFGIRRRFDVSKILLPLSKAAGVQLTQELVERIKIERRAVMQKTFYRYASFEDPKISKALVLSAIDLWTWYWILAELLFLLALTAGVFAVFNLFRPAILVLILFGFLAVVFTTLFQTCARKAKYQIEEIVSDPKRVEKIRAEFGSLLKRDEPACKPLAQ